MADPAAILFTCGVAILTQRMDAKSARTWIGKLRKELKDDEAVAKVLAGFAAERPAEPAEWLQGALRYRREGAVLDRAQRASEGREALNTALRQAGIDPNTRVDSLSKDDKKRYFAIARNLSG